MPTPIAAFNSRPEINYFLFHATDDVMLESILTILLAQGYDYSDENINTMTKLKDVYPEFRRWKYLFVNRRDGYINAYEHHPYGTNESMTTENPTFAAATMTEIVKGVWAARVKHEKVEVELTPKHVLTIKRDGTFFRSRKINVTDFIRRIRRAQEKVNRGL